MVAYNSQGALTGTQTLWRNSAHASGLNEAHDGGCKLARAQAFAGNASA